MTLSKESKDRNKYWADRQSAIGKDFSKYSLEEFIVILLLIISFILFTNI